MPTVRQKTTSTTTSASAGGAARATSRGPGTGLGKRGSATPGAGARGPSRSPGDDRGPSPSARDFFPRRRTLPAIRSAAARCRGCPLWKNATQTVFGEGVTNARVMLVGETPGDREDIEGRPFVGPAGRVLDEALAAAGIERNDAYVTNVVKHFKWEPRGKRRLHRTPNVAEIRACLPWLEVEIDLVKPQALVCLGATAAKALLGREFLVTRDRGRFVESPLAPRVSATVHPSSLLRIRDRGDRETAMERFIADLAAVRTELDEGN